MRGKAKAVALDKDLSRITPAYAGKSYFHENSQRKSQDHPRLCGEKFRLTLTLGVALGSPPPMRGKVNIPEYNETLDRITPAYAGKRNHWQKKTSLRKDHPRLCGEKACFFPLCISELGSPPPMRGKDSSGSCFSSREWDHPRLCGEKRESQHWLRHLLGSPPPMRGKV